MTVIDFVSNIKRIMDLQEGNDTDTLVIYYLNEVRRQYSRLSCYAEFLINGAMITMSTANPGYVLPDDLSKIIDGSVTYTDSTNPNNIRELVRQDDLLIKNEGVPIYWKRAGASIFLSPNTEIVAGDILTFSYYKIPDDLQLNLTPMPEPNLTDLWTEAVLAKMSRTLDTNRYKLFSSEEKEAFRESRAAQD